VPAAAVIPAIAVYTNVAAVKTLVVDSRVVGPRQASPDSSGEGGLAVRLRAFGLARQVACHSPYMEMVLLSAHSWVIVKAAIAPKSCVWLLIRSVRGRYHEQNSVSKAADVLGCMRKHGMARDRPTQRVLLMALTFSIGQYEASTLVTGEGMSSCLSSLPVFAVPSAGSDEHTRGSMYRGARGEILRPP